MNIQNILQSHLDKFKNMVYTISVGRIIEINKDDDGNITSVDVLPQVHRKNRDGYAIERPTLFNVPILFPATTGGILSFPLKEFDPVLVAFCGEDIQRYLQDGAEGPGATLRKFSETDAIALPCLFPFGENPGIDPDNVVLKFHDSHFLITPDGDVEVNSTGDFKLTCEGDISATSGGATYVDGQGGLSLTGKSEELISLLVELATAASDITPTSGSSAGSPTANKAILTDIANRLGGMKP